jgi:hypothetical protein
MVEFRVGPSGPRLMEINGRVWGSLPLAVAAGVDFPRLCAALLLDGEQALPATPLGRYRIGVRTRDLQRDVTWIATVLGGRRRYRTLPFPRRRAALGALAGFLDPRRRLDAWARDDPLPALLEVNRVMHRLWAKRHASSDAPLATLQRGTL